MRKKGKRNWLIPDMYWPEITSEGHYVSHESVCVLNLHQKTAKIHIDLYFEDRDAIKDIICQVDSERTKHIRMDGLKDKTGNLIVPRGIPYAAAIKSTVPVVVQYTRVDTTQSENALMTTIAY